MWRALGWLGILVLALSARWYDSDICRGACAFLVLALIGAGAPRALRFPIALTALIALTLVISSGVGRLFDALPALIAALVAWIFARSLYRGRTPLIGRAIAAVDGAAQLDDPAVARYARRLTWVWAVYQTVLAAIAMLLAARAAGSLNLPVQDLNPRWFGAIVLPLAVATLFLGEFVARRWLLPQAPRHRLVAFVRDLIRVWPSLLGD
jgi:uncharacterized membrane protein